MKEADFNFWELQSDFIQKFLTSFLYDIQKQLHKEIFRTYNI